MEIEHFLVCMCILVDVYLGVLGIVILGVLSLKGGQL
jgi:hypothetical protein